MNGSRLNVIINILQNLGVQDRTLANNINNGFVGTFIDMYGISNSYESIRIKADQMLNIQRRRI